MSELGHRQPQSAMMAGPDGVVYIVTSAGAVPSAHATAPARPEATRGHEALRGQQRASSVVTWCFSYDASEATGSLPAMPVSPCFSYSADGSSAQIGTGVVGPCFSYSADSPPASTGHPASKLCFSFDADLPPGYRQPQGDPARDAMDAPGAGKSLLQLHR